MYSVVPHYLPPILNKPTLRTIDVLVCGSSWLAWPLRKDIRKMEQLCYYWYTCLFDNQHKVVAYGCAERGWKKIPTTEHMSRQLKLFNLDVEEKSVTQLRLLLD